MSTITESEAQALINANRQAEIRAADTRAPFHAPDGLKHLTPEELQLIALFRCNDERGQKLVFRIVTLHAVEYPKKKE